jgi:hypothetical protein
MSQMRRVVPAVGVAAALGLGATALAGAVSGGGLPQGSE